MAKLVSNVYGDALFELAVEQDKLDDYLAEVQCISQVLQENPDFCQVMNHPKITKEEKTQTVEAIFKGHISDELLGLLCMVVEKGHFGDMEDIIAYFIQQVMKAKNIGVATVTTPMELTDAQKQQVEQRLLDTTDYVSFHMNYVVDADLIGGMVIRIGDRVVDSSVRTKLYQLSRELSKIQLKVGESAP
jgi:F-type H+-transporting ATPase subunit delta